MSNALDALYFWIRYGLELENIIFNEGICSDVLGKMACV